MNVQIKDYFLQNFMKVSDEWLSACINFLKSEHGINNTENFSWVKEKVYEQWLYSDLTTLGTFCLPFSLSKQKSVTITGHFTLQINHISDIGSSAYSQLQKLHKDDVENSNVSAEKVYAVAWEPKPTRMLLLQLTDGTSVIQGMEYRPISSLSLTMKPGVKVLLKGPIEVRRGILLLTKDHVSLLGGEVETLLVSNAPENILRKALRMEESENPIPVPESLIENATPTQEPSQYYNTQSSQNLFTHNNHHNNVTNSPLNSGVIPTPVSNANEFSDDFEDFMDSEMEMALIEAEQRASGVDLQPQKMQIAAPQPALLRSNTTLFNMPGTSMNRSGFATFNSGGSSFPSSESSELNCGGGGGNAASLTRSNSFDDEPFGDDDDDELLILAASQVPASSSFYSSSSPMGTSYPSKLITNPVCVTRPLIQPNSNMALRPKSIITEEPYQGQPVFPNCFKDEVNKKVYGHDTSRQSPFKIVPISQVDSHNRPSQSLPNSNLNIHLNLKQQKLSSIIFEEKAKNSETISDSSQITSIPCTKESIRSKIEDKPPYQYICYMNRNPLVKVSYTILGFVTTLLSKLEQSDGKWLLTAKINDGTGFCDVDIDDLVLRELMGMSVEEFKTKKEEALFNPELKRTLGQRLCRCQMELIKICCLLQVENSPSLRRPKIVGLMPLTESHLLQLRERSVSLNNGF